MLKLEITTDKHHSEKLIQQAVAAKVQRLMLGLRKTDKALRAFETKYQRTSADFLHNGSAEDLAGGDADYITWLGEFKLRERIQADLAELQAVKYVVK
ncbi:hypothetical protein QUF61_13245 [Candidatus Venteria ishoeyi]|uniref:hypothetical protein n=1 Tax=Candidatus Venteria ishoeyi TaxID=1899563 RepID=UPI0025A5AFD0|nr:hypothetical protein [Candidatus Venteria ishoeyi]MDM8547455.1 hypothetical protein [Candidatus Venteria ishoeyi]